MELSTTTRFADTAADSHTALLIISGLTTLHDLNALHMLARTTGADHGAGPPPAGPPTVTWGPSHHALVNRARCIAERLAGHGTSSAREPVHRGNDTGWSSPPARQIIARLSLTQHVSLIETILCHDRNIGQTGDITSARQIT